MSTIITLENNSSSCLNVLVKPSQEAINGHTTTKPITTNTKNKTDYFETTSYELSQNDDSFSPQETKEFLRRLSQALNLGILVSGKLANNINYIKQRNANSLEQELEKNLRQIIQEDPVFLALGKQLGGLQVIIRASDSLNDPSRNSQLTNALATNAFFKPSLLLIEFGTLSLNQSKSTFKTALLNELQEGIERYRYNDSSIFKNNIYQTASAATDTAFIQTRRNPTSVNIFNFLDQENQNFRPLYRDSSNGRNKSWSFNEGNFAARILNQRLQFYFGQNILSSVRWETRQANSGNYALVPVLLRK